MKTRITEMFQIQHPILLSGMSWIATPEMAAAVSEAGGLGMLATGVMSPRETREAVRRTRELTSKPFGANVTLYFPTGKANAEVLLEERVPVINCSMGKADWVVRRAKEYGGKVIATVVNEKHALGAKGWGVDALLVTGHEAAAHGGEATTMVLVPTLASATGLPIVAAGGIADGRGLAAALALGADGVAMGTRLMMTRESPIHAHCKEVSLEKGLEDTLYSTRFDGQPCRVMKAPAAIQALRRGFDPFRAIRNSREVARMLEAPWFKMAVGVAMAGAKTAYQMAFLANAFHAFRVATVDGELDREGVLPLGQNVALVRDIPGVRELLERTVAEAEETIRRLGAITGS
ncbi:MAG TPA: nitronate monooxygenase [Myxococcota bacterium]|nr:nitronate monooxygenase [Myxococcota bacterium]HQK50398.1 nitronate monooxygenase [Myxococcota bacterium]